MGFALVVIGLLMVVTGGRGTYQQFGSMVANEFVGTPNFTYWIVALGAVGAIGYIDAFRTMSRLLMTLIIIVLFLSQKGFFASFNAALKQGPVQPQTPASAGTAGQTGIQSLTGTPGGQPSILPGGPIDVSGWLSSLFGSSTAPTSGAAAP